MTTDTTKVSFIESMDFCAAAVIQSAHDVIVEQAYGGICNVDPSTIMSLTLPLHSLIRETVRQVSLTLPVEDVDWNTRVLEPIVANFQVVAELGISAEDVEYVILIGTVVTLAYEILLLPGVRRSKSACTFVSNNLNEYLCEPDIYDRVAERLQLEQHRLEVAGALISVQDAIRALRRLMPDIWTTTARWERKPSVSQLSNHQDPIDTRGLDTRGLYARGDDNHHTQTRDLHIAVFLKPNKMLSFDFVESIDVSYDIVVVKTHFGLRMELQPGFHVSEVSGMFDTVTILGENDQMDGPAANIIVPPGYSYRATNVESVFEAEAQPAKTVVETSDSSFEVSHGDYVVKRRNSYRSVLIESTEC